MIHFSYSISFGAENCQPSSKVDRAIWTGLTCTSDCSWLGSRQVHSHAISRGSHCIVGLTRMHNIAHARHRCRYNIIAVQTPRIMLDEMPRDSCSSNSQLLLDGDDQFVRVAKKTRLDGANGHKQQQKKTGKQLDVIPELGSILVHGDPEQLLFGFTLRPTKHACHSLHM